MPKKSNKKSAKAHEPQMPAQNGADKTTRVKKRPIEKTTMFSLILAGQVAREKTAQILSNYNLTSGDDAVLLAVQACNEVSKADLADLTGQKTFELRPRLDRLGANHLINEDETISLTEAGQETAQKIEEHWNALDAQLLDGKGHKTEKKLRKILKLFGRAR